MIVVFVCFLNDLTSLLCSILLYVRRFVSFLSSSVSFPFRFGLLFVFDRFLSDFTFLLCSILLYFRRFLFVSFSFPFRFFLSFVVAFFKILPLCHVPFSFMFAVSFRFVLLVLFRLVPFRFIPFRSVSFRSVPV